MNREKLLALLDEILLSTDANSATGRAERDQFKVGRTASDVAQVPVSTCVPRGTYITSAQNVPRETFSLAPDALDKLDAYAALLLERNREQNLVGPAAESALESHIADSLAPLALGLPLEGSLVDVGSGAGLPGLPLAVCAPQLRVTLLDSNGKRCDFLRYCARELGLSNLEVLNARAEELAHTPSRERFDLATARAVTAMPALCELCLPLVRVGGRFVAYKSARAADELAAASSAIRTLGGSPATARAYTLDGAPLALAVIEKRAATSAGYPRAWGRIKSKPL